MSDAELMGMMATYAERISKNPAVDMEITFEC